MTESATPASSERAPLTPQNHGSADNQSAPAPAQDPNPSLDDDSDDDEDVLELPHAREIVKMDIEDRHFARVCTSRRRDREVGDEADVVEAQTELLAIDPTVILTVRLYYASGTTRAIGIPVAVLQRRGNGIVSAGITKEVSVHLVGCVDLQAPTAVIDAHNRPWVAPRGHFKCKSVAVVDRRVVPKGAHFFRDAARNRASYEQSQRNAREALKKEWYKPAPSDGVIGAPSSLKREAPSGHASKPKRVARS